MKPLFYCCTCLLLVAGLSHAAPANDPPLTLATSIEAAWQRALDQQHAAALQQQHQQELTAGQRLLPKPAAMQLAGKHNASESELELGMVIPLWLPGQQQAGQAFTQSQIALAKARQQAIKLDLAGQVIELLWQYQQLKLQQQALSLQQHTLQRLNEDIQRQLDAGERPRTDWLAAQARLLQLQLESSQQQQQQQQINLAWQQLTGLQTYPRVETLAPRKSPQLSEQHPALQQVMLKQQHARQTLHLRQYSLRDNPELSLGLIHNNDDLSSSNSLMLGLHFPLYTPPEQQVLLQAAENQLALADTELTQLREKLTAELQTAVKAEQSINQQLTLARQASELQQERSRLLQRAFELGEKNLAELLHALTDLYQSQSLLAQQQAALANARLRVQQSMGVLP